MSPTPSKLDVYMWTKVPGPSALGQARLAISVVICDDALQLDVDGVSSRSGW